jgi:hypothetical protein
MSTAVNALNDELDALLARLDAPAHLERRHLAGRVCADLRTAAAVWRHLDRLTEALFAAIHDAATSRSCLVGYLGGWTVQHEEVCTLMADVAQARDRLTVALDAFETDETITAAIRAFTTS